MTFFTLNTHPHYIHEDFLYLFVFLMIIYINFLHYLPSPTHAFESSLCLWQNLILINISLYYKNNKLPFIARLHPTAIIMLPIYYIYPQSHTRVRILWLKKVFWLFFFLFYYFKELSFERHVIRFMKALFVRKFKVFKPKCRQIARCRGKTTHWPDKIFWYDYISFSLNHENKEIFKIFLKTLKNVQTSKKCIKPLVQ